MNLSGKTSSTENESDNKNEYFENLFEFNVMSTNSIVKGYDLSFSMPDGNIGNMYAIQAMGGNTQITPSDSSLDYYLSLETITQYGSALDGKYIRYKPDIGSYRANKIDDNLSANSVIDATYDRTMDILGNNFLDSGQFTKIDISDDEYFSTDGTQSTNGNELEDKQKTKSELLQLEIINLESRGKKVTSFKEYYKYGITGDFLRNERPTPLPLTLTLNIYGIASIIPGDVFRVDYLPENYRNAVYFQVMKVSHNVNPDG